MTSPSTTIPVKPDAPPEIPPLVPHEFPDYHPAYSNDRTTRNPRSYKPLYNLFLIKFLRETLSTQIWPRTPFSKDLHEAFHEDQQLVVKTTYSCSSPDRAYYLYREVYVFLHLHTIPALREIVPTFMACGDLGNLSDALVTCKVGHAVERDANGTFFLNGQALFTADVEELREAALKSLRVLHSAGFVHGDIELRHIRAEYQDARYRVWFVDLTFVAKERRSWKLRQEERQLRDIFDPVYKEMMDVLCISNYSMSDYRRLPRSLELFDDLEDEDDDDDDVDYW